VRHARPKNSNQSPAAPLIGRACWSAFAGLATKLGEDPIRPASPPFCTMPAQIQRGVQRKFGRTSRRSPEGFCFPQVELGLQFLPERCSRRSRPKASARAPPGMAIQAVLFKRAVRAGLPPHVEKHPPPPTCLVDVVQLRLLNPPRSPPNPRPRGDCG
jgi:hypothetical protein